MLAQSHALCALVDGEGCSSMMSLGPADLAGLCTPVTEAQANLDLCSDDLDPLHDYAKPGQRPSDLYWPSYFKDSVSVVIPNRINLTIRLLNHSDPLCCSTLWAN